MWKHKRDGRRVERVVVTPSVLPSQLSEPKPKATQVRWNTQTTSFTKSCYNRVERDVKGITLRTGCRGIKVAGYMNPRKYHCVYVWFLTALVFLAGGAGTRTRVRLDTWKAEAGRWSVFGQPRQ